MSQYEPDVKRMLSLPTMIEKPKAVVDAERLQSQASDASWSHFNEFEDLLVDGWAEQAEREMVALAERGESVSGYMDRQREVRAMAIAKSNRLAVELREAISALRAAVFKWVRESDILDDALELEADARAENLAGVQRLTDSSIAWEKAAALAQWCASAYGARAPVALQDFANRAEGPNGLTISKYHPEQVIAAIETEHDLADRRIRQLRGARLVEVTDADGESRTIPEGQIPKASSEPTGVGAVIGRVLDRQPITIVRGAKRPDAAGRGSGDPEPTDDNGGDDPDDFDLAA